MLIRQLKFVSDGNVYMCVYTNCLPLIFPIKNYFSLCKAVLRTSSVQNDKEEKVEGLCGKLKERLKQGGVVE
jgi:hypothetical protein